MNAVLGAMLPIFGLILTGWVCGRRRLLGPAATDSLNLFVVWLALPALLFQAMADITGAQLAQPGFLAAFTLGMLVPASLVILPGLRRARLADLSIEALCAAYANTGFMGIPICLLVLGPASLAPAILSTLLTACVLFAAAIALIELDLQSVAQAAGVPADAVPGTLVGGAAVRSGGRGTGRVGRAVLRVLVRNPLVVSPIAGLAWAATGLRLPAPVLHFTTLLGDAATPCALVTIGLFLAQPAHAAPVPRARMLRSVGFKLLLQPAITAVLALLVFPMPVTWSHAAVLLSAMPAGTGPFMLAKLYEREPGLASRAILVSTLGSVLTIAVLLGWLG